MENQHIVAHHRELQQHLINLGVTVAAHGHQRLAVGIQPGGDSLGIIAIRQRIPWPVV
ncbi:hypothetical protein D3C81_1974430 [compost metagenome]